MLSQIAKTLAAFSLGAAIAGLATIASAAEEAHVSKVDKETITYHGVEDVYQRPEADGGAYVIRFVDDREPVELLGVSIVVTTEEEEAN